MNARVTSVLFTSFENPVTIAYEAESSAGTFSGSVTAVSVEAANIQIQTQIKAWLGGNASDHKVYQGTSPLIVGV